MHKPILLYTKHRQTIPILEENKKDFILIDFDQLWKYLRIFGKTNTSKIRAKVYLIILKTLKPEIILDINWIGRVAMIHYLYSKKKNVKLLVVQHGFYTGGYISDRFLENRWHKMARCTHFWIWSDYIKREVLQNNSTFLLNGNPVYNSYFKNRKAYREIEGLNKVLILPTAFENEYPENVKKLNKLLEKLRTLDISVSVKLHSKNNILPDLQSIELIDTNLYEVLHNQDYDLIITDHSTSCLDAIFFNNYVAFCNFHDVPNTLHEQFLGELNLEKLASDLLVHISQNRTDVQTEYMSFLGFDNLYDNSLVSLFK